MKKLILLFLLLAMCVSLFAVNGEIKEKKPFPKYMYKGEVLDLSKYFDMKGVYKVTVETKVDPNFYPRTDVKDKLTNEEEVQLGDQTAFINTYFRIFKIQNDKFLSAEGLGNRDIILTFYFENDQILECPKFLNISVVEFDGKELKNLSDRYNAQKILVAKIVTGIVIFLIIVILILIYLSKNFRLVRKEPVYSNTRRHTERFSGTGTDARKDDDYYEVYSDEELEYDDEADEDEEEYGELEDDNDPEDKYSFRNPFNRRRK
ncbi:MAG: hypothetical protein KBT47_05930 [Armatimonadetes bacterium]|nr:hypothetical protein [Candidatus Hippobium faecium]